MTTVETYIGNSEQVTVKNDKTCLDPEQVDRIEADELKHFDAIIHHIGTFGRWHCIVIFCYCCFLISLALQNTFMPFLGYTPKSYWCKVPDLVNLTYGMQKNLSIPFENEKKGPAYSKCTMYADRPYHQVPSYESNGTTVLVPPHFYDSDEISSCQDGWVYDVEPDDVTAVTEWDLVCGKDWLAASGQSFYMLGFLFGCLGFGSLSDKFGRRTAIGFALLLHTATSNALVFSNSYAVFSILRIGVGASSGGGITCFFTYVVENIAAKYRNRATHFAWIFYSCGYCLVPLIAWAFRNWRQMQLVASAWNVLLLLTVVILPESPRWLYAEGKSKECEAVLRRVAKTNGKPFPEKFNLHLDKQKHLITVNKGNTREPNFIDLVRTPNMRKKTLVLMYEWFVVSMVYFGLTLSSIHLGSNKYITFAVVGMVELPSAIVGAVSMKYLGRRLTLVLSMFIGGVSCILTALPFSNDIVIVVLATIGKFNVMMTFGTVYLYSSEIYPTVLRTMGVGSNSVCARLGAIIAPYISMLGLYVEQLPLVIFGIPTVIAGFLALFLPETTDWDLPETVEDGEKFGRNQKFWTLKKELPKHAGDEYASEDSAVYV